MEIKKIDKDQPGQKIIRYAAEVLKSGGLVVYPTDTAYGLGANALDERAIRKMYEAKGRDFSKPTHVVVKDWQMVQDLAQTNIHAKKLFDTFLPGPLTIILKKKAVIPNLLTSGLLTVGIRIPKSAITQTLSFAANIPYTATSANLSGGKTPYSAEVAIAELGKSVDLVLDAGRLPRVLPSTIIDVTQTPPVILRPGPVTKEKMERVLGDTLRLQV